MMISLQKTEITEFGNCGIQKLRSTEITKYRNTVILKKLNLLMGLRRK
jgi:hypothetical protein